MRLKIATSSFLFRLIAHHSVLHSASKKDVFTNDGFYSHLGDFLMIRGAQLTAFAVSAFFVGLLATGKLTESGGPSGMEVVTAIGAGIPITALICLLFFILSHIKRKTVIADGEKGLKSHI